MIRRWGEDEVAMLSSGMGPTAIARATGRTVVAVKAKMASANGRRSARRFAPAVASPEHARDLATDHPAVLGGTTRYPSMVVDPAGESRLLRSGENNPKIGAVVEKGRLKGLPIYTLTLEERATCPRACAMWRSCFDPETRVLTSDYRWIRIGDVVVGDQIIGFDEEPARELNRRFRTAQVQAVGRVVKPSVRVVTDLGSLVVSADHPLLGRRKPSTSAGRAGFAWFRSDSFSAGDQIGFLAAPWETDETYDGGRVRGFVEGEGYVSLYGAPHLKARLGYSQIPGRLYDEITALVRGKGFQVTEARVKSGVRKSEIMHGNIGGGWPEVMRFLGVFRPTRLMENAQGLHEGHGVHGRGRSVATVLRVESVGDIEVVEIATTTKTLVANGFLAHNCYGNSMHHARRLAHGPEFERLLVAEIDGLMERHRLGILVRLHVLGDFYSVEYADLWAGLLARHPRLHVFGFTAWGPSTEIGRYLGLMRAAVWPRFAVRFSNRTGERNAFTLSATPRRPNVGDAIVCVEQWTTLRGDEEPKSCGTCALCWSTDRPIAFVEH